MISIFKKIYSIMKKIDFDIFFAMTFIVGIILISRIFYFFQKDIHSFSNLVAIYAIIGGILGSLFIFIIGEGLRDKEYPYKIKIFFKSSKLITIIILFLFLLAILPFYKKGFIPIISFISLFGFIILGVYAISQIALVTLNADELWNRHIELFKNKIKEVTKFSQKIKSNSEKFYKFINSREIRWFIPEKSEQAYLKSLQEGIITNVKLGDLENIIKEINKQQSKQISKSKDPESNQADSIFRTNGKERNQAKNKGIILHIYVGQEIKKGSDLLSYDEDIQIDIRGIEKKLNNSVVVEKTTVLNEFQMELENYRSMIKKYIEEENTFQFTRYFELYFKLAEEFLNQLPKSYSYQEAKREIKFVPDSNWAQLGWLQDHIMDFFSQARDKKFENQFKTENLDQIYSKIKWLSYHLINLSKEKKDHLLFQMAFHLWIRQLYYLSKDTNNFKKSIKDHFNFFENRLIPTIFSGEEITKEIEEYAIYLLETLKNIFGWILKEDKKFEFLNIFKDKIIQIINNRSSNIMHFQGSIINMNKVFNEPQSYDSRKLQFLFGLGAYLDSQTRNELKISDEKKIEFDNIQNTIKNFIMDFFKSYIPPFDLKNFLNIYTLMKSREVDSFWRWSFLNMPADGQWRKREENTEAYFLKLMLDIPQTEFEELKIEEIDSQTLSHLEYLNLTKNQKPQTSENNKIHTLLQKVSAYQDQKRVEYISKENLEQNKIKEFRKKFEIDFKETAYMRTFFKNKKVIQTIKNEFIWDMDYIDFKSYFISHKDKPNDINLGLSHPIDFSNGMPEAYSEGLSDAENKFLQAEILKKCAKKEISYSDFRTALTDRQWKNNEEVILVSSRRFLKTIEDLIEWDKKDNNSIFKYNFLSKNGKIPLKIDFLIKNQNVNAVIFDTSKLPILEMFNPINAKKELFKFHFLEDIGISIGIDDFSSNDKLMEFMIKNPPDWLIEKGSEKDQREYLKQMVNIKILQGLYLNWEGIEGYIGEYFVIKN